MTEFGPDAEAASLTAALRAVGTPERAAREQRYLRSELEFLGATVPTIRRAATALRRRWPDLSHRDLVALVRRLWGAGVFDLRMVAVELLRGYRARLSAADLDLVEELVRDSHTWALVDSLAGYLAGELALRYPEAGAVLDRWSTDPDFWVRRSALLALLPGIRAGRPDLVRLDRFADAMLAEREFFVRKAIGWVLRELSRRDPAFVAGWVGARTARIAGVTIREAVRHLPADDRARLLAAYRDRVPAPDPGQVS